MTRTCEARRGALSRARDVCPRRPAGPGCGLSSDDPKAAPTRGGRRRPGGAASTEGGAPA